ncbi:tetratricopeptide repeat protein [bacterium]|nr:tetratricopeptide repeat protein [bacterium]
MQETLEYVKQAFELKNQKCYKQSIEMLYKALEIENDNPEILFQLGELYFLLNNYQRAQHYLEKVLSKNENHVETLELLAKIYEFSNDAERAFFCTEKLLKLKNDKKNTIKLIEISSKKGNLDKIEEYANTKDADILYSVAKAYYDNKLLDKSKEELEKALKIEAENENVNVLLGKIYFDGSEFDKAREIFQKFPKTTDNPEILNYIGLFALEDLNFTEAIKCFSKASNIDKLNSKYFYNLGNAYFYNGWLKEALTSYLQAIRLEPENNGFRYSLAYLYFENKQFGKAQSEVDYILHEDVNYAPAHVLNALLKLENKDYLNAKLELETNIKNGHDDNFTLVSLVKVYTELGVLDKAEEIIKKVMSNNPESLNYKCNYAQILCREKKYDEAIVITDEIIKDDENYIMAYIVGAQSAFEKKDFEKAKYYAQNAISLDMNFSGGYYYLALVRFEEKDYDEAIECMKRAITYDVDNAEYYAEMSGIYEAKGDYKNALEYIKEAENISGNTEYKIIYKRLASLNRKNNLTKK